jgi:outer membrane protein OmpA-like peptidoglycan-associated protein
MRNYRLVFSGGRLNDKKMYVHVRTSDGLGQAGPTVSTRQLSRSSPEYIRWVQRSLNNILGTNLRADGIIGSLTRSAVRSFQQKQGLVADGVVDSKTEAALIKATDDSVAQPAITVPTDTIKPSAARLTRFDKTSARLKDFHVPEIDRVADKVLASWETGQPIFIVYVKGHTSSEGSAQYNIGLGNHRALAVRKALQMALERKRKNLSYKVLVLAQSKGAREPIDSNETDTGKSQNRRVEIFLSTKKLLPLPKKKSDDKPTEIIFEEPDIVRGRRPVDPEAPLSPPGCRREQYEERRRKCEKEDLLCKGRCLGRAMLGHMTGQGLRKCLAALALGPEAALACVAVEAPEAYERIVRDLLKCRDNCNSMLFSCLQKAKRDTNCM